MKLVVTEMTMIITFKRSFPVFLMMALTSQQSLVNPMILRDVWLTISLLFVLTRRHTLTQIRQNLIVCFSWPLRIAHSH